MAGQRHDRTVFPARRIKGIGRIRKEHLIQHMYSLKITRLHAKQDKFLLLQLLRLDVQILFVFLTRIQCLTLRKESVLR